MACPACGMSFTVVTLGDGKRARCPRCKGTLNDVGDSGLLRTDAEFSTRKDSRAAAPAAGPAEACVCIIGDHPFRAVRDASGRARCPSCQTSFLPK